MGEVNVRVQQTPNPNSMLYHVDRAVTNERMRQFNTAAEAADSPLASALFDIEGVASIFFMPNSVTVSKEPDGDWSSIVPAAESVIRSHFEEGED